MADRDYIEVPCPCFTPTEDGDTVGCTEVLKVELGYNPPDPNYGADADGNRGIYVEGGFYVHEIPGTCPAGHVLDAADEAEVMRQAERAISEGVY